MNISTEALSILKEAKVNGNKVVLPPRQLERSLYEEVNEVLLCLGGKWKGRGKHPDGSPKGEHLFPYEIEHLLQAVLETGLMPPKNPTAFFPTPKAVVYEMLAFLDTYKYNDEDCWILEPSAGQGGILELAKARFPKANFDVVEYLDLNAQVLRDKGYRVYEQDFMNFVPEQKYHLILMNPPFSLEEDKYAWISHTQKAFELLREDGMLVAIVPASIKFNSLVKVEEFRSQVEVFGGIEDLPEGAFKESGTGVATCLIYMEKKHLPGLEDVSVAGYISWFTYNFSLYVDNDYKLQDELLQKFKVFHKKGYDVQWVKDYILKARNKGREERMPVPFTPKGFVQIQQEIRERYNTWLRDEGLLKEEKPNKQKTAAEPLKEYHLEGAQLLLL